jgi:hypothetical protein
MMTKDEYRNALRSRLTSDVPLEKRRTWTETDLLPWFLQTTDKDSYLRWRAKGDPWQHAKGFLSDLIGKDAVL